ICRSSRRRNDTTVSVSSRRRSIRGAKPRFRTRIRRPYRAREMHLSMTTRPLKEDRMQKIATTLLAGMLGVATPLSGVVRTQSSTAPVKNIVLVHGAFADGSSWAKVIPILEARGFHTVAVQNPLTSLADDVKATRRIIAMQDGPVILVGHSWGGAVITEAGDDPKVAGLVYVAADVPDAGTSANDTHGPYGFAPCPKAIPGHAQDFPPT